METRFRKESRFGRMDVSKKPGSSLNRMNDISVEEKSASILNRSVCHESVCRHVIEFKRTLLSVKQGVYISRFLVFLLTVLGVIIGSASTAMSAQKSWVPTTGGAWTTAANWNPSGQPATGDTVTIPATQSANITAVPAVTLGKLIVNGSCTLQGSANGTITVSYVFQVSSGVTLTLYGTNGGRIAVTLATTCTGTINGIYTGTNGAGNILTVNGILIMGASGTVAGTANFTLASGATLKIASTTGVGGNITTTGTKTYNVAANYEFNGTVAQVVGTAFATCNNLTISDAAGTVTLSQAETVSGNLTITDGAALVVPNYAFTVTGSTTVGGVTSGTLSITATNAALLFTGLVTINAGATWSNSGNDGVTFRGGITNNATGTFTAGSGVYTFNTNAQALTGTFSIPSVTVTTITLTNNNTLTVGTALSGTGGLTQAANATLNIGGTSGITALTATANPNTVNYTGTGQTLKVVTYWNLTMSGGAETFGAITTVNGNLTLSGSATATLGANLAIGGNLNIGDGTTFTVPAFTIGVTGTTTVGGGTSGTLTISSATGTRHLQVL